MSITFFVFITYVLVLVANFVVSLRLRRKAFKKTGPSLVNAFTIYRNRKILKRFEQEGIAH